MCKLDNYNNIYPYSIYIQVNFCSNKVLAKITRKQGGYPACSTCTCNFLVVPTTFLPMNKPPYLEPSVT